MHVKIITNLTDAASYIRELQKENDELRVLLLRQPNEIVKDSNFRLYGKTVTEIRAILFCYETYYNKENKK